MIKNCKECGKEYLAEVERRKYCSVECFHLKSPRVECICKVCGKTRKVKPADVAEGKGKYCSPDCYHKDTRKRIEMECQSCGKTFETFPCYTRKGVKYCSRDCWAKAYSGENHPWWNGGKTSENGRIRGSGEYATWRKFVFSRDNFTCQDCGEKASGHLHAHHIFPFADFPEHHFEVWNGLTLCETCHKKYHSAKTCASAL